MDSFLRNDIEPTLVQCEPLKKALANEVIRANHESSLIECIIRDDEIWLSDDDLFYNTIYIDLDQWVMECALANEFFRNELLYALEMMRTHRGALLFANAVEGIVNSVYSQLKDISPTLQ